MDSFSYDQYSGYQAPSAGMKRPAKPSLEQEHSQPKRFAPSTAPGPFKSKQVKPRNLYVEFEPSLYRGYAFSDMGTQNKINGVVRTIVREMRNLYFCPPHNMSLMNYQIYALKRRITERIDKMLMNKPLVPVRIMHDMYRDIHTAKGDLRLIEAVQAMSEKECKKPISGLYALGLSKPLSKKQMYEHRVTLTQFMRQNLRRALETKLKEIFSKVHKIYAGEPAENPSEGAPDSASAEPAANPEGASEAPAEPTAKGAEGAPTAESAEPADAVEKPEAAVASETVNAKTVAAKKKPSAPVKKKGAIQLNEKDLSEALEVMLKRKLPLMLPRYKSYITALITRDPAFAGVMIKPEQKPPPPEEEKGPLKFVKILGKPTLPLREVMQAFLKNFEPGSVKKHKTAPELLFVGVSSAKYEELLRHDKQTVGGKQLLISAASQDSTKKDQPKEGVNKEGDASGEATTETAETKVEEGQAKNGDTEPDVALKEAMTDLDNQIDDLLTSIKEADEDKAVDKPDDTGDNFDEPWDDIEDNGDNVKAAGDNAKNFAENVEGTAVETEVTGETPGNQAVEKGVNVEEKGEEKKTPDTPASSIRTRRSSRLPQKN